MTWTNKGADDGSMWLRRAGNLKLISAPTALEIARLVVKDEYGQLEVDRNEPLSVSSDGDTWIVKGSQNDEFNVIHPPVPQWSGPVRMKISQFDGQILSYIFTFEWEYLPIAPEDNDEE